MAEEVTTDQATEQVAQQIVLSGSIAEDNTSSAVEIIFDNFMRHTIRGHNNITNHYVENGIAIQDTTTVDPLVVTIQGYMGELVYSVSPLYQRVMSWLVQTAKVPVIGGFVCTGLTSPVIAVNAIYERVRGILATVQTLNNKTLQNKKLNATLGKFTGIAGTKVTSGYNLPFITFDEDMKLGYQTAVLERLREYRIPVDVSLRRVGVFHNMYLEDYEWDQDKAYYHAKVTITFKQIRTTETQLTEIANSSVDHCEAEST